MNATNNIQRLLQIMLLWLCAGIATTLHAEVYTWQQHDIAFEAPDNGWLVYSTNSQLELRWDDMVVTITLYTRDNANDNTLKDNLRHKAAPYMLRNTKEGKIKHKQFKGFTIEGTMHDGSRVLIADLNSKKRNLIIEVTVNYLYGNREAVDDLIASFAHGKQPVKRKTNKQHVQPKSEQPQQPTPPQRPHRDDGPLYDA